MNRRTTAFKITSELNEHTQKHFLHKNYPLRVAQQKYYMEELIRKPLLSQTNVSKRSEWCMARRKWFLEQ